jgi:hypothetical protein
MSKRFVEPDWEKLQDASTRTGLSVSELFRQCMLEEVESVHIVKPGKLKGVRLISKKSLDDYIRSFLPGGIRFQKSQPTQVRKAATPAAVAQ